MPGYHRMHRFTIVAPHVRNDGSMSGYPAALREALLDVGIDGWTEYETHGAWRGKREAGTTFELYREAPVRGTFKPDRFAQFLGDVARDAMGTEQEAIQIAYGLEPTMILEASSCPDEGDEGSYNRIVGGPS